MNREMRFKLLESNRIVASGMGATQNISSGGIAFHTDASLPAGAYIELSISWPMLLDDRCPMRLIVFGRVLRSAGAFKACTVEKYEFRTQARQVEVKTPLRIDSKLLRWAEYRKDVMMRTGAAVATV